MFSKFSITFFYLLSLFTIFAAATTTVTVTSRNPEPTTISQCNTGEAQCCNTVDNANVLGLGTLLGLLGIVIQPITAVVGLGCTPITVGAGGGVDCSQHPVCCENNNFQGLINIGCFPITL